MAVPKLLVTRSDEVMSGAVVFTGTPAFLSKLSSTTSKKGIRSIISLRTFRL